MVDVWVGSDRRVDGLGSLHARMVMSIKFNTPVNVCIECGGEFVKRGALYVCKECGEAYRPDEVGFTDDMSPNVYRGERMEKDELKGKL